MDVGSRQLGDVGSNDSASSEELAKTLKLLVNMLSEQMKCHYVWSIFPSVNSPQRAHEHSSESNQTIQGRMNVDAYMLPEYGFPSEYT